MRKKHSKTVLSLLIFALVFSAFPLNVESQSWENQYGRLEVYPDISYELITQKQFYNVTWFYPDNDLDIAFRFNESLSYGGVYFFNGISYNKVGHSHIEYNSKHYYVVSDIHFVQNEDKHGYWEYNTPINSSGKWDMFVKLSSDSWQYAFNNDRYIHLDPWWNSSWTCMKQITINHSYIDSNLVNFPILVHSSNTTMLSKMDTGNSLRFTNIANDTKYNYEIEYFDDTDEMVVWVNVTSISSSADTVFNMYYNNSGASDGQNVADTWDNNFLVVYHLTDLTDSANNNDLSNNGATTYSSGNTGGAYDFDGVADYLYHSAIITNQDDATFELFASRDNVAYDENTEWLLYQRNPSTDAVNIYTYNRDGVGDPEIEWSDERNDAAINILGTEYSPNFAPKGKGWFYTALSSERNGDFKVYLNDSLEATDTNVPNTAYSFDSGLSSDDLSIGARKHDGNSFFDGKIDELRISDIIRSTSWLNASFHSQNQTTNFIFVGDEYDVPTYSTFNIVNPNPVNNSEILCLNLSQLCVDINFSCGSGDYINITLVHDGNITYLNDTTSVVNDTYCLSLSGINLTVGQEYTWWVNVSSSCAEETVVVSSWYNFTCEIGCDCYDELVVINYKLDKIQQTLDDGVGVGGISGPGNILGMVGLFGLFGFIGYLSGKKRNDDL